MSDNALSALASNGNELCLTYAVNAALLVISSRTEAPDEVLLGKLLRRRLSRLERVLVAHGGSLVRQLPQGLVAAFDSAETAIRGASEMQRRCAVIPQISETQIGLKIAIHPVSASTTEGDSVEALPEHATQLGEGTVVASPGVVEALPDALREKASAICDENGSVTAHLIDWGTIPMLPTPAAAPRPAKPIPSAGAAASAARLILRHGGRSYRFGGEKSMVTIGRDPVNDVVIAGRKASRQHCRIFYRLGNHVLVDLSMNGTYVKTGDAREEVIRKSMLTLSGSGQICFGHSCDADSAQIFEFEIC